MRSLNAVATEVGVDAIPLRASVEEVRGLYRAVRSVANGPAKLTVSQAKDSWEQNGGAVLGGSDTELETEVLGDQAPETLDDEDVVVDGHSHKPTAAKGFRLQAKAFMLTFNCLLLVHSKKFWDEFLAWVKAKAEEFRATWWSATLEQSLHSDDGPGRIHLHVYYS